MELNSIPSMLLPLPRSRAHGTFLCNQDPVKTVYKQVPMVREAVVECSGALAVVMFAKALTANLVSLLS